MSQVLTKDQQLNLYMWCVDQGVNLEYGKLSLCDLRNFRHSFLRDDRKYQVHCDDPRCTFTGIYESLEPAVRKFLELKNITRRMR